jgi:hypothetical protein
LAGLAGRGVDRAESNSSLMLGVSACALALSSISRSILVDNIDIPPLDARQGETVKDAFGVTTTSHNPGLRRLALLAIAAVMLFPAGLAAMGASIPPPPEDPKDHLHQILNRPLYQRWLLRSEAADGPGDSPLLRHIAELRDQLLHWIGEMLARLFGRVAPLGGGGGGSGWEFLPQALKIMAWVALALAVVMVVIFGWTLWRKRDRHGTDARILSREHVRKALEDGQALALDSPQWLREADRLAGEQDLRAVYRALYLALLSGLHAAGKIDFRATRTNWVYVRRFRGPDVERDSFSQLTGLFDQVWYGQTPAEPARIHKQIIAQLTARGAARA